MKAISLYPPWSTYVTLKMKTIETRTHDRFRSLIGQRIAIHAAKKIDEDGFFNPYAIAKGLNVLEAVNIENFSKLSQGKIVCTARVFAGAWADLHTPGKIDYWSNEAMIDVKGKFMIFLDDIKPVWPMIPFRGRQGIFEVPDKLFNLEPCALSPEPGA